MLALYEVTWASRFPYCISLISKVILTVSWLAELDTGAVLGTT